MSTYGHFIVEVRDSANKEWNRVTWSSPMSLYRYRDYGENKDEATNTHDYLTISQHYSLRDWLRNGDFGHTTDEADFTESTREELSKLKDGNGGWYEGYFTLKEFQDFIKERRNKLDRMKQDSVLSKIYDEVRVLSNSLVWGKKTKPVSESQYDSYCIAEEEDELNALVYIENAICYLTDEVCGYTAPEDIRVIVWGD